VQLSRFAADDIMAPMIDDGAGGSTSLSPTGVVNTYMPGSAGPMAPGLPQQIYAMAQGYRPQVVTKPVLIGAGVGFLIRGVTGAVVGGLLGLLWKS
jgi:hypothetical protein